MTTKDRLILVRHGASEWSHLGRYQGHQPVPLSSLGLQQVYALAEEFQQYNIKQIISSDLQRAKQTAEIIAERLMLDIHYDARLRELDCGTWTGLTEQEIEALDPNAILELRSGLDIPRGGGETMGDLLVRVHTVLIDWVKENFSGTIMFVTHAYVIRAITQTLLRENMYGDKLPSLGSYTVLNYEDKANWTLEKYGILPSGTSTLPSVNWLPTF